MNQNQLALKYFLMFSISIAYIFIYSTFPSYWFRDRVNYVEIAKNSGEMIDYHFSQYDILFHEPIFLYINKILLLFINPQYIPNFFVFFITSSLVFFLFKKANNFTLFLLGILSLIVVPFLFHMQLVVLRQALATVLFILILFYGRKEINILIFLGLLPLVHASFALIFVIYFMYVVLNRRFSNIFYLSVFISLFLFLFFNFAMLVATYLGFYQIGYIKNYELDVSGGAFVFFIFIFISLLYVCRNQRNKINDLAIIFTAIYLLLYFVTPLIGRYMVTFFPFILLSLVERSKIENYAILVVLIVIYSIVSYNGAIFENSLLISSFSEMNWRGE